MNFLPKKRQKPRSGIERAPKREWPRHRSFVRGFVCVACGEGVHIEFAHVRSAANSGTALKPHDAFGVPLCAACHREQHAIGQPAFERKHSINLLELARQFLARSPDRAMKESLKLVELSNAQPPARGGPRCLKVTPTPR